MVKAGQIDLDIEILSSLKEKFKNFGKENVWFGLWDLQIK